jgi:hypothetical protein
VAARLGLRTDAAASVRTRDSPDIAMVFSKSPP